MTRRALRFGDAEARRIRATTELVAAASLFGFMVILLGFAGVELLKRGAEARDGSGFMVSPARILQGCLREIGRLSAEVAREGWTPERAGSALTVLRIGTRAGHGAAVAQALVDRACRPARTAGVTKGIFGGKRVVVSAPTTSGTVRPYRASGNGQTLEQPVRERCWTIFVNRCRRSSAARYGRNGQLDGAALDRALETAAPRCGGLRIAIALARCAPLTGSPDRPHAQGPVWTR